MPKVLSALPLLLLLDSSATAVATPSPAAAIAAFERGPANGEAKADDPLALGSLAERMRRAKTPGLSIAVIDGCRIAWTHGYGRRSALDATPVNAQTRFQAASISKTLTAVAALRLVSRGALDLDKPVNTQLRSWRLPAGPGIDADKVTPRGLLSHTAGTTVEGYPGYPRGGTVPTLDQVLAGSPPATTPGVIADKPAGAQIAYSGGGYVVMQKLIEDVTGTSFATVLEREVLSPTHMRRSSFGSPNGKNVALGHDEEGQPVLGGWRKYPELAPAGLWTTSADLAQFGIRVAQAYNGAGYLLPQALARDALRPQSTFKRPFGLGFRYATADNGDVLFFHPGSNAGYRAILAMDASRCQGVAVLTNSEGGTALWMSLLRDISRIYRWPFLRTLVG